MRPGTVRLSWPQLALMVGALLIIPTWLQGTVSLPNTFVAGEAASAAAVNANFTVLADAVNTNETGIQNNFGQIDTNVNTTDVAQQTAIDDLELAVADLQAASGGGGSDATYRWAVWSSYGQSHGVWYGNNNNSLFGGVFPSNWGDGGARASQMSSDLQVLGTLFNKKGYANANATIWADEWYSQSSTNSKHAGALFRIENTTGSPIDWTVSFFATAYGGWGERASVSLNGSNWDSGGSDFGPNVLHNLTLTVPANSTATAIFVAGSSSSNGTRSCFLAFSNDSLSLPAGLQFVDDLP